MKAYSILIVQLLLYLIAFGLASSDMDSPAYTFMNISVAFGCFNSTIAWFQRRKWIAGLGIILVKAYIIFNATYWWWTLVYDQHRVWDGITYFFGLSPVLFIIGWLESFAITRTKAGK